MQNQLSLQISQADLDAVHEAIGILESKLGPHLVALSDKERSSLNKLGDKTQTFVEKAYDYSKGQFSKELSSFVNNEEFNRDLTAFKVLGELNAKLSVITRKIEDSTFVAGSESLNAALVSYAALKICIKNGTPGAQDAYNELKSRFKRAHTSTVKQPV